MKMISRIIRPIFNRYMQAWYFVFGSTVECNICRYKAAVLSGDAWHKYAVCPNCWSGVRQRLLWAALNSTEKWGSDKIIKNKAVLHFAPERALSELIAPIAGKYRTADLQVDGYMDAYHHIDYNMDISDMHQLRAGEYDCVIACDVLEHVYDDKKALEEVYRILGNGGYCIFTVPQKDRLEKTYEDLSVTDPKEREKEFGQSDHLRIYGNDFVQLMENAGFNTVQVDENNFGEEQRKKNVLYPPVLSAHPLATNYRKIFIGCKG